MALPLFLILFPLLPAALIALIPHLETRKVLARISAAILALAALLLLWNCLHHGPESFSGGGKPVEDLFFWLEMLISGLLILACRHVGRQRAWIPVAIFLQAVGLAWIHLDGHLPHAELPIHSDHFAVIMAVIVGVIGSLTAVYSIGYMTEYSHHHPEVPVRRRRFFFTIFVFLSAMFGIIFSNSLSWLHFFWEITTVCSFVLIGYADTPEARRSALHALGLNVLGGFGFLMAMAHVAYVSPQHIAELDVLQAAGPAVAMVPAVGLACAGLAKAAQLPFSRWLLSAMVAPTPVSALLHSSTMVKAGVLVLVRFAPVFHSTVEGMLLSIIGGITFLIASIVAVSQTNAKRVLGCSTVANLGLVTMCAGIGTPETLWAALLLIIFHAVAKALLFLGLGPIEHRIGSRDIELMDGLISTRPTLGLLMVIGICGMFLAPFGMLISKYAAIRAFLDHSPLLASLIAFGSAPTLFFWSKWMGKILCVPHHTRTVIGPISLDKWVALLSLAVGTLGASILFPWIGKLLVEPHVREIYGTTVSIQPGNASIMVAMFLALVLLPILYRLFSPRHPQLSEGYLAGVGTERGTAFRGSMGATHEIDLRNYYLSSFFDERPLMLWSIRICALLLILMVALAWI